jgi:GTPase involved in cell partitioning and DNA repair
MKIICKTRLMAITALLALTGVQACNPGPDYKEVRKEVIDQHDQLMMDDERVMHNKMKLDTLALNLKMLKQQQPALDTAQTRVDISELSKRLAAADDQMSEWMHHFKVDMEGKSNAEAVAYFKAEKVKVQKLDSLYKQVLNESDAYLEKFNIKNDAGSDKKHDMKM